MPRKMYVYVCVCVCVCGRSKCEAIGLKECLITKNIFSSFCEKAARSIDGKCPQIILLASKLTSRKSVKEERSLNCDTDDETQEDKNDFGGNDSDEESRREHEKDDDSDDGVKDGNIDIDPDGNT